MMAATWISNGNDAGDAGAPAGGGVAPLGEKVQFNVIERVALRFPSINQGLGDNFGVLFDLIKNRQSHR